MVCNMILEKAEALAVLEWYRLTGVDEAIGDEALPWFDDTKASDVVISQSVSQTIEPIKKTPFVDTPPLSPIPISRQDTLLASDETMSARELARNAKNLAELQALVSGFDGCALKQTAKNLCFARGSEQARLMLIGEAPGKDEDRSGVPFVGRAGQLLDRMMKAIDLDTETDTYITNLVFWRPPGNRTPSPEEVQVCYPFLQRQIELLSPSLIVFLGGAAAKQMTGTTQGILKLRGQWLDYASSGASKPIRCMATLHPAYLLRNTLAKRLAWRDLLSIRQAFDGITDAHLK